MATITYTLRPAYVGAGFTGSKRVDEDRVLDIDAELAAGGGMIVADADDFALIHALDEYPALMRSGAFIDPAVPSFIDSAARIRGKGSHTIDLGDADTDDVIGVDATGALTPRPDGSIALRPLVAMREFTPTGDEQEVSIAVGDVPESPSSSSRAVYAARRLCRVTSALIVPSGSQALSASSIVTATLRKGGGAGPLGERYEAGYREKILAAGPSAYLPLTESSGTVADNLVGTDGTYSGSPTLAQDGPFVTDEGLAVQFDGVDDHVILGAPLTLGNEFTYEAWVYPIVPALQTARQTIIGTDDSAVLPALDLGSGNSAASTAMEGSVAFAFGSTYWGQTANTAPGVRTQDWSHIVGRRTGTVAQGGRYEEFVNGQGTGAATATGDLAGTAVDFRIGRRRWTTTPTQYFNGRIAHVALYPRALTRDEMADHAGVIARKTNRSSTTIGLPGGDAIRAGRPWPFTTAFHPEHSVLRPGDTVILDVTSGGAAAALGECTLVLGVQPLRDNLEEF